MPGIHQQPVSFQIEEPAAGPYCRVRVEIDDAHAPARLHAGPSYFLRLRPPAGQLTAGS